MTHLKQWKLISSPHAVLDVSFNSGHYTVIIKRQFLYINIQKISTTLVYMLAPAHDFVQTKSLGQEGQNLIARQKGF